LVVKNTFLEFIFESKTHACFLRASSAPPVSTARGRVSCTHNELCRGQEEMGSFLLNHAHVSSEHALCRRNFVDILHRMNDSSPTVVDAPSCCGTEAVLCDSRGSSDSSDNSDTLEREADCDAHQVGKATTVMMRNLPNNYTREMLMSMINQEGFKNEYDFFYLPIDFNFKAAYGYAFVNLVSHSAACRFWHVFQGFHHWTIPSRKECCLSWSNPHQGLRSNIERYRNSPIMHDCIPDEYKPVMLSGGKRVAFAEPTKKIARPRHRRLEKAPSCFETDNTINTDATDTTTDSDGDSHESPTSDLETATTVMMRNLPNNYTRELLVSLLKKEGFGGHFDFLYLPIDFSSKAAYGYAFVNLVSHSEACRFWGTFHGFSRWAIPSRKECSLSWSNPHQGLWSNIERYRNSPIMHASIPDEYKPLLLSDGKRVAFPEPTKRLARPRYRILSKH